ncbi:MAG: hypothetical protein ACOCZ8_07040, partial [Bacteroidota bacterium]
DIMDRENLGMDEKLQAYRKNMEEIAGRELPHPTQITPESIQEKFLSSIMGESQVRTLSAKQKAEAVAEQLEEEAGESSESDADPPNTGEKSSVDDVIERYQQMEKSLSKRHEREADAGSAKYEDLSLDEPELSQEEPPVASETLAIINARQGNMDVAREMIDQLKLKNPEKSTYFDELLKRLEGSQE